jgi:hypothetical protein
VLRTNAPLGEFYVNAEAAVTSIHPQLSIEFTVLTRRVQQTLMRDRLMTLLAGAFGLLAGTLAVLGLYGVIVHGGAAAERDRRANCARGEPGPRDPPRDAGSGAAAVGGTRDRAGARDMVGRSGGIARVWDEAEGSSHLGRGGRAALACGTNGQFCASETGGAIAADGCVAGRVTIGSPGWAA